MLFHLHVQRPPRDLQFGSQTTVFVLLVAVVGGGWNIGEDECVRVVVGVDVSWDWVMAGVMVGMVGLCPGLGHLCCIASTRPVANILAKHSSRS